MFLNKKVYFQCCLLFLFVFSISPGRGSCQDDAADISASLVKSIFENEPSVRAVQEAALKYNEVHPSKIKMWRRGLKIRGLFPTLSLDYDKTIYGTAGSSTTSPRAFVGPRDWGVSFSWNIADLIWNSYEDDVDTRSRLSTVLRIDIIDEVNRIYFARLRLKLQLIQGEAEEEQDYIEGQILFQELTAILDGYTGGFFSKRLAELR